MRPSHQLSAARRQRCGGLRGRRDADAGGRWCKDTDGQQGRPGHGSDGSSRGRDRQMAADGVVGSPLEVVNIFASIHRPILLEQPFNDRSGGRSAGGSGGVQRAIRWRLDHLPDKRRALHSRGRRRQPLHRHGGSRRRHRNLHGQLRLSRDRPGRRFADAGLRRRRRMPRQSLLLIPDERLVRLALHRQRLPRRGELAGRDLVGRG